MFLQIIVWCDFWIFEFFSLIFLFNLRCWRWKLNVQHISFNFLRCFDLQTGCYNYRNRLSVGVWNKEKIRTFKTQVPDFSPARPSFSLLLQVHSCKQVLNVARWETCVNVFEGSFCSVPKNSLRPIARIWNSNYKLWRQRSRNISILPKSSKRKSESARKSFKKSQKKRKMTALSELLPSRRSITLARGRSGFIWSNVLAGPLETDRPGNWQCQGRPRLLGCSGLAREGCWEDQPADWRRDDWQSLVFSCRSLQERHYY